MKKIKDQLKIGIILNYVNLIVGNLIPIFYTPIMLNLLGQSEYGLYKLASSVTSYISLMSLGIGSAMTRYLIKSRTEDGEDGEKKILGLFSIIFSIIAIASFIIGTILVLCLGIFYSNSLTTEELSRMKILVFMMVVNMAFSFAMSPYLSVANAHEKFIYIQVTNILTTCVTPLINLLMLYLGFASIGLVTSSLIMSLCINFSYMVYVRKQMHIKPIFKQLPVNILKEILKFSFWIFVANIVTQLYNATDTVLIGAIPTLATTGVAVYNIGATFNNIVISLTTGFSNLLGPKINKMVFSDATNHELSDLAIKIGRLQCYIIMLLISGFISFGKPFLEFYAGKGYEDAYLIAIFMMIPNVIPLIQSVFLSIIVAKNMHRFRSLVYLLIAVINIIGTWILLNYMGIIGAALMTGLALLLGQGLIMNIYYSKKVKLDVSRFWKKVFPIIPIPVLLTVITKVISNYIDFYNIFNLLIGIIIFTLLYCVLNWFIVFNKYEKSLILNPVKKFIIIFKNKRGTIT